MCAPGEMVASHKTGEKASEWNLCCQHLDLGLPACRTVRTLLLKPQSVVSCYGSQNRLGTCKWTPASAISFSVDPFWAGPRAECWDAEQGFIWALAWLPRKTDSSVWWRCVSALRGLRNYSVLSQQWHINSSDLEVLPPVFYLEPWTADLSETRACCFSWLRNSQNGKSKTITVQWNKGWCVSPASRFCIVGKTQKALVLRKETSSEEHILPHPLLAHSFCCAELVSAVDQQFLILFVLFYHLYYRLLNTKHLLGLGQSSCLWHMFPDWTWFFKNPKEKVLKGSFHPPLPLLKKHYHIDYLWKILIILFSLFFSFPPPWLASTMWTPLNLLPCFLTCAPSSSQKVQFHHQPWPLVLLSLHLLFFFN